MSGAAVAAARAWAQLGAALRRVPGTPLPLLLLLLLLLLRRVCCRLAARALGGGHAAAATAAGPQQYAQRGVRGQQQVALLVDALLQLAQ